MTNRIRLVQIAMRAMGPLALLWLLIAPASADCVRDIRGEVFCGGGDCVVDSEGKIWCSRFYKGGADRTRDGSVVCGKGQCTKDTRGEVFCSSEMGGAVLRDSRGRVRCYGHCERATSAQCEHTAADSSS